ncbi:protein CutA homolog isoform X1 [Chiloscyllium punctatum]|uniref:protein CutA homolog isoform X1 n=1 Tax=Chiloscyllium punctatum TaxID=137246 RepID=UPI003B639AFA
MQRFQGSLRLVLTTLLLVLLMGLLIYPGLKNVAVYLHSAVTGSYISGTHSLVFLSCPNEQVGKVIARTIVEKKLAACVSILPKVFSIDWNQVDLVNYLIEAVNLGQAGRTWLTNITEGVIMFDCLYLFHGYVQAWVSLEKEHVVSTNTLELFRERYNWDNEITETTEVLMVLKTRTSKIHKLSEFIRSVHPFEVPEVISILVDQGNPLYLKWIEETVLED